jgi:hypothetical protein
MTERVPKLIREFCRVQRISNSHFWNLQAIGRGPRITEIGGVKTIRPEDEDSWIADIAANPIRNGVRAAAEKARQEATAA